MEMKTYNVLIMLIVVGISAMAVWAVYAQVPVLVVAPALVGMAAIYLLKKKVTGVVADEMSYRVVERAARLTYAVFLILAGLVTGVIMALRDTYPGLVPVGYTLAYSVDVIMILYWSFYVYYSKKGV